MVASTVTNTITVALPEAQFGTPASGWSFAVVLTGQDGFSSDQARGFAATPQDFAFGVCAARPGRRSAPSTRARCPRRWTSSRPGGVSQATELDPTLGPVVIRGVPVP